MNDEYGPEANHGPIYPYIGCPWNVYSPIVRIYPLEDHPVPPFPLLLLPLPEPEPELVQVSFIPKSAFSSKVPLLRALSDPVEISVDTYSSAHCDPTMISSVLASLKEISLLPVPLTPF